MSTFITPEVKAAREEFVRQEERRKSEIRRAQVKAFLKAIKDICKDVEERVTSEYENTGAPPSSVRVVCKELTTAVASSEQCSKALLSALKELEEHTSSLRLEAFEPTIYNPSGHSYVVVNFSWK
ncbi:hypothetical protein TM074_01320 [Candidatus Nanosynbacter sp. TM7-074]|uniref:Uncharacterized protein n=1 Tax=Candidatus Nanosynbacter sp. TM7-074 TaxID=3158573 RepID=A0AB39JCV4_9BACT